MTREQASMSNTVCRLCIKENATVNAVYMGAALDIKAHLETITQVAARLAIDY